MSFLRLQNPKNTNPEIANPEIANHKIVCKFSFRFYLQSSIYVSIYEILSIKSCQISPKPPLKSTQNPLSLVAHLFSNHA